MIFLACINIYLFLKTCIFIWTSSPLGFFIITCIEGWTWRKIWFLFCRSYNWHNNASLCCFILLVCFSLFSFEYRSALDKTPHLICIAFHLAYTRSWSCMVVISDLRHLLVALHSFVWLSEGWSEGSGWSSAGRWKCLFDWLVGPVNGCCD